MSICIFPGRFQPFHNGHLLVVQGMVKMCGRCVIVICHGEKMGSDDVLNPSEVREALSAALLDNDIMDATIVEVVDTDRDEEWADKILEAAERPSDAVIWSGESNVLDLFNQLNVKTKKISKVPGIDGAQLRQMIKTGHPGWKAKVPVGVAQVVNAKAR
jgi:nicotinamide-nucleotide adenylyltransferase